MARHGIATARYRTFTDIMPALEYIHSFEGRMVVKAAGLAAGKGVVVASSREEAAAAATAMLASGAYGEAGREIVVEEYLEGEEASFIVIADGVYALPLASSQDHKARDDGDRGPNTGGMGAYSPAPVVTPAIHDRILREVIEPTLQGLAAEGTPYRGFLYAGVMIASDGTPKVLEFNCRFGDPETQPILMRLSSDLVDLCTAALDGPRLSQIPPAVGPARRARRGARCRGISGYRSERTTHFRTRRGQRGGQGIPCRDRPARRGGGHERRSRAVCLCAR